MHYEIRDNKTGTIIARYKNKVTARRLADRKDLEYGAVRYIVVPVPDHPPTPDRPVGFHMISVYAMAEHRAARNANHDISSWLWYDIACAAIALDTWGTTCLARDEQRMRLYGRA